MNSSRQTVSRDYSSQSGCKISEIPLSCAQQFCAFIFCQFPETMTLPERIRSARGEMRRHLFVV